MSVPALKRIIKFIQDKNSKEFRKQILDMQVHSLVLKRNEVIPEIANTIAARYQLTPFDKIKLKNLMNAAWPSMYAAFKTRFTNRDGLEFQYKDDEIIITKSGSKDNYGSIYASLMKPAGAMYKTFWGFFLPIIGNVLRKAEKSVESVDEFGFTESGEKRSRAFIPRESVGSLLNLGHYQGSNIQYLAAFAFKEEMQQELKTLDDLRGIMKDSPYGMSAFDTNVDLLTELSTKFNVTPKSDFKKTITLRLEFGAENQERGRQEEVKLRNIMVNYLKKIEMNLESIDWINQETSDSPADLALKLIMAEGKKAGFKTSTNTKLDTKSSKAHSAERIKIKNTKGGVDLQGTKSTTTRNRTSRVMPSYINLITLINEQLPPQVRSNMGSPRLNNQTGRFSESARVTSIISTPTGLPSIEYTYQRSPYDVFDKTKGKAPWNTPERDPSSLVSMSVRQIAQRLGMRRFYTRRAS